MCAWPHRSADVGTSLGLGASYRAGSSGSSSPITPTLRAPPAPAPTSCSGEREIEFPRRICCGRHAVCRGCGWVCPLPEHVTTWLRGYVACCAPRAERGVPEPAVTLCHPCPLCETRVFQIRVASPLKNDPIRPRPERSAALGSGCGCRRGMLRSLSPGGLGGSALPALPRPPGVSSPRGGGDDVSLCLRRTPRPVRPAPPRLAQHRFPHLKPLGEPSPA